MDDYSDADLLRRFREQGDRLALSMLFERHRNLAFRVALRVLGRPEDAEDAAQEAFVSLIRYEARVRPDASLAGLVARMALRAAQHSLRADGRRHARESEWAAAQEPDAPAVYEVVAERQVRTAVRQAVAHLEEPYRVPVELVYFEGLTARETADALGISHAAARMRLSRAMGRLRADLGDSGVALSLATLISLLREGAAGAAPPSLAARLEALAAAAPRSALLPPAAGIALSALKAKGLAAALVVVAALGGVGVVRRLPPPPDAGAATPPLQHAPAAHSRDGGAGRGGAPSARAGHGDARHSLDAAGLRTLPPPAGSDAAGLRTVPPVGRADAAGLRTVPPMGRADAAGLRTAPPVGRSDAAGLRTVPPAARAGDRPLQEKGPSPGRPRSGGAFPRPEDARPRARIARLPARWRPVQVSQAAPAREPNGEAPFNAHAGTIRGTVFDRQDNPLAGVTVGLVAVTGETRAATTNAQGRYEIAGIPPGRCTLSARKAGLAPQRQVVDSLRARQVLGVSFRLGPWSVVPWSISGTVTHEDGKTPFAGATVRHYRERVPGHWEWGSEQTTDDTGAFAFPNLPAGRYRVFLFAPGCFPRWVPGLALRPGSDHQEVNLILFAAPGQARPGTLPLEALGPDGRPLANTMGRIVLRGDTLFTGPSWGMGMIPIANRERPLGLMVRREIEGWVTTDAAGRLECTVPPGTYRVTLRAVGCHPLTQPLSVVPGERGAPVQFRMAAGTDTLEDPGVPRVGAGAAPAAPAAVAATAPAVPAGTGAPAAPAAAPAGGTAAAPAAPAARSSIRGTLLRPDGRPLADSGAYLFGAPSRLAENGQYDRWAYLRDAYVRTDAAGRFEKRDAPAGQTSLSLKVRGYAEVQVAGVDLPAGDTAEQVFRLAGPALRATGRVLTPEGAPVEHAWVFAYRLLNRPKGDRIWSEAMDTSTGDDGDAHTPRLDRTPDETLPGSVPGLMQHGLTYTETDADGAFTLADLDAGTYDFGATAPNYSRETREKVDLRAGMPPLAFALVAHGGIEGRLLGPGGAPLNAASQMVVDLIAGDGNRVWSSATAMWNMLPDGRYHVADVPPGTYRLSITVDGCRPASREEVVVRPGAVTTGVDLSLEWAPRVVLRGRALKPDGRPAAGAVLWWRPGIGRTGAEAIGMSAADGTFALDAPPAESGALHWRLAGYAPGVMEVAPRSAAGTPLEVRFSPSVTLRGSVRDVAGAALQAVRLYWCRQETAGTLLGLECMPETQTGPDGAFELTDVLAGPICLTVEKAGFLSVRETRDLAGQVGEVTLDMALQTGPAPGAANPVAPSLVPARPAERALEAPPAPATTPRPASAPDSRPVPTLPQPIRVGNASLLPPFAGAREDGAAALAVPRANA